MVTNIITVAQALAHGLSASEIRNAAEWHKLKAGTVRGRDRERHFHIAGRLNTVANELSAKERRAA